MRKNLPEVIYSLFVRLISHQPAVFFSQNKPATSNQPAVLFSQNKSAPAISHQPNEQADSICGWRQGFRWHTSVGLRFEAAFFGP
jgi:hypothetical protein